MLAAASGAFNLGDHSKTIDSNKRANRRYDLHTVARLSPSRGARERNARKSHVDHDCRRRRSIDCVCWRTWAVWSLQRRASRSPAPQADTFWVSHGDRNLARDWSVSKPKLKQMSFVVCPDRRTEFGAGGLPPSPGTHRPIMRHTLQKTCVCCFTREPATRATTD